MNQPRLELLPEGVPVQACDRILESEIPDTPPNFLILKDFTEGETVDYSRGLYFREIKEETPPAQRPSNRQGCEAQSWRDMGPREAPKPGDRYAFRYDNVPSLEWHEWGF